MSANHGRFSCTMVVAVAVMATCTGCQTWGLRHEKTHPLPPANVPSELSKVALPPYVIEPPDVLSIEVTRIVPRGEQVLMSQDVVLLTVTNTLADQPISGPYVIDTGGAISLGPTYGMLKVAGLTPTQARGALEQHLSRMLQRPMVSLSVMQSAAKQQLNGEFLVSPDGSISLGVYGNVFLTGATLPDARQRIYHHLSRYLVNPDVAVDVVGFNSKTYYIITEGAGFGDGVNRFPITGNETVLDAIAQINGLSQVSSKKIWISRPAPDHVGPDQILPVDWVAITKGGSTATNYQVFPGDRIFVAEDHMIAMDTHLGKMLAPFERIFGFTLLGTTTVQTINRFPKGYTSPTPSSGP